ncbi:MAG: mercuric transport protein MerTP [Bacteroidetes bacterium]|nr:MAG: mercuric transport protein MerTP [Bacteroidota bacterium]
MKASEDKTTKKAVWTGVFAAVAASSCCIPPVIAAIAGVGGIAGSLSWLESARPYLIVVAVLAIGYAWYNYYKVKKQDSCGCDVEKPKWYQSKTFLIVITIFAILSISFPYYSFIFFPKNHLKTENIDNSSVIEVNAEIEGMTCEACEHHVNSAVSDLPGVLNVQSSYKEGKAVIYVDTSKVTISAITEVVNQTGYQLKNIKIESNGK